MQFPFQTLIASLLCATLCSGCSLRSRWAIDDPVYAEKYAEAKQTPLAKVKQAVDARHVGGGTGCFVSAAASSDPITFGGTLGAFGYGPPWLEGYAGLTGLLGTGAGDAFGGLNLGVRAQTPSRFAPFAGVGTSLAFSEHDASDDLVDNDHDGLVDEFDEEESALFASVYPELGAHFWLNEKIRLTGSASYHVTTEGRDYDYWFYGVSIGWFLGGNPNRFTSPSFSKSRRKSETWQWLGHQDASIEFGSADSLAAQSSPEFDSNSNWPFGKAPPPVNPYLAIPIAAPPPSPNARSYR